MSTMLPPLEIDSWTEEPLSSFTSRITSISPKMLILIDGVAGSGKTTLAVKLSELLNANIVKTDDISWCADPVKWDCELIDEIITPWQSGKNVAYTPSGWIKENRSDFIEVDSDKALIIEGTGAARKTLRSISKYSIWVDTEPKIARERVVNRDIAAGENGGTVESVTKFADWWDSLLLPLFLEEKPWKYVDVIVSGDKSDLSADNIMIHVVQYE